jgi:hypothetical protein
VTDLFRNRSAAGCLLDSAGEAELVPPDGRIRPGHGGRDMDSTAIVEQVVRKGWAGADASTLEELVSPGRVTELLSLFHRAFTDVGLNEFGPIFSNADGTMVAFFGEMHLRQVADFLHVSAVGRQADVGFTGIFRVDAGKVAQMWAEMDFAALYVS